MVNVKNYLKLQDLFLVLAVRFFTESLQSYCFNSVKVILKRYYAARRFFIKMTCI